MTGGYWVECDPDTVITPYTGFVRRDRSPESWANYYFLRVRPDLVAEVISPLEDPGYIELKREVYDRIAVPLLWWIDAERQRATIHMFGEETRTVDRSGWLDGGSVLPGFSIQLNELFEDLPSASSRS